MKKTPKIIRDEMKHHNMAIHILALADYNLHRVPARDVVRWMKKQRPKARAGRHLGDPCIHCGTAHDEVAVGDCPKNTGTSGE